MASKQGTADFILDQLSGAGAVTAKKMFGEYGIFLAGKMIALITDDRLFFKPTAPGRLHCPAAEEASPYPGAKPCLLIPEEDWDDREWLCTLATVTANALPLPKPKKPRTTPKS